MVRTGIDQDHPQHIGEKGCLYHLPNRTDRQSPLCADVENSEVAEFGARPVMEFVQSGTGLARSEGIDLFTS